MPEDRPGPSPSEAAEAPLRLGHDAGQLGEERRGLLRAASRVAMLLGLGSAYGTLGAFMARYLYPTRATETGWMYVTDLARLKPGGSLVYRAPDGAPITVARSGPGTRVEDFVALSSVCPHLGCQVHWEPQNQRFFCPCHNGVFDPGGKAVSGPPAEGKQDLSRYPLKIDRGLLFISVPLETLAAATRPGFRSDCSPPGPGHDPCLYASRCGGRKA